MKKILTFIITMSTVLLLDFTLSRTALIINKEGYLSGFQKFYERASETKGQKRVILMGGSSIGWGVSAEKLTSNLGVLTLNSGIHAGVGYRHFIKNLEDVVDRENDLIIISPEYSIVAEDHIFGRSTEFCEISISVRKDYPLECIGFSISKLFQVIPILNRKTDDYFASGFNEYGDYVFRQNDVNMVGQILSSETCQGFTIQNLEKDYLPYMMSLQDEGYTIYYIPNFIPKSSCDNPELIYEFHQLMFDKFGIQGFADSKLLYEDRYFYNTDYHLTREGVALKTNIYNEQLYKLLNGS